MNRIIDSKAPGPGRRPGNTGKLAELVGRDVYKRQDFDGEMDDASYHIESIEEKGLPIDPINAYNLSLIHIFSRFPTLFAPL